jgi:serine/threonine protein kinase
LLGEGSYGSVYKALHKLTGELYAVKIISIVGEAESLKREISILKDCKSTFIVRFLNLYKILRCLHEEQLPMACYGVLCCGKRHRFDKNNQENLK